MNLQKIESVDVDQSILGRVMEIVGTEGKRESFKRIRKLITFRKRFQDLSIG